MNVIKEPLSSSMAGYIQFMVYDNVTRQTANPLGEPVWCGMEELTGNKYGLGTQHRIDSIDYTVAMIPFIGYVDHPSSLKRVLRRLVYMVRSEEYSLLPPFTGGDIYFPGRELLDR